MTWFNTFDEATVHDVGHMAYTCSECDALMFREETNKPLSVDTCSAKFSLCCSYGKVKLPLIKDPPKKLQSFLTGNTARD